MRASFPPLIRWLTFGLLAMWLWLPVHAEERSIPEGWRMGVVRVPSWATNPFEGPSANGLPPRLIREANSAPIPGTRRYDLRAWLGEHAEVRLPANALVEYDEAAGVVVMLGPSEEVALIETLFTPTGSGPSTRLQLEATLVSFECAGLNRVRNLPYQRLRSIAGESWLEVEHLMTVASSGQRAMISRRVDASASAPSAAPLPNGDALVLAPGELGSFVEFEPVIGPDGETIELNYHFHRRTGPEQTERLEAAGTTLLKDGTSVVVTCWPPDTAPNVPPKDAPVRLLALVIHAQLLDLRGEPLRRAFGESIRELRLRLDEEKRATAKPGR